MRSVAAKSVPPFNVRPSLSISSVYLIGGGGHSRVVRSVLCALEIPVAGILDDDTSRYTGSIDGIPLLGPFDRLVDLPPRPVVIAIGDNRTRSRLADRVPWETPSLIHPRACVDPTAVIGPGTIVMAGAIVQPGSNIGEQTIINTGASVDHDCRVGDFAHLCPGSRLAGEVSVGRGVLFGTGAVTIPGCQIGDWTVVGAGAVVICDLPAQVVAVGNPAKTIREVADSLEQSHQGDGRG